MPWRGILTIFVAVALTTCAARASEEKRFFRLLDSVEGLTSYEVGQAKADSIVQYGEEAISGLLPLLHSDSRYARSVARIALGRLCGTEHVLLLLDECLRSRLLGVRAQAVSVVDEIFRTNPDSLRPMPEAGQVDEDLSELAELALSGEWEGVDLTPRGEGRPLIVGAGLRTDRPMSLNGQLVEVVPLAWEEFSGSVDARSKVPGRPVLWIWVRVMTLNRVNAACDVWRSEYNCVPTAAAFASLLKRGYWEPYGPVGHRDLWVKCGGQWHHMGEYIVTEVSEHRRRAASN